MKNKKLILLVGVLVLIILGVASISIFLLNTRKEKSNKKQTIPESSLKENMKENDDKNENDVQEKDEKENSTSDFEEKTEEIGDNVPSSEENDNQSITNIQQPSVNNNENNNKQQPSNNNTTSSNTTNSNTNSNNSGSTSQNSNQGSNSQTNGNNNSNSTTESQTPVYTVDNDVPADPTLVVHVKTLSACRAFADNIIQQHEDSECLNGCRFSCTEIYGKYTFQIIGYMVEIRIQDGKGTLLQF